MSTIISAAGVRADPATYDLHILIRFELEVALLEDALAVADLPASCLLLALVFLPSFSSTREEAFKEG